MREEVAHHFRFVHRTPVSPTVLREYTDQTTWSAKVGFGRRWVDGVDRLEDTLNTIEIYWCLRRPDADCGDVGCDHRRE